MVHGSNEPWQRMLSGFRRLNTSVGGMCFQQTSLVLKLKIWECIVQSKDCSVYHIFLKHNMDEIYPEGSGHWAVVVDILFQWCMHDVCRTGTPVKWRIRYQSLRKETRVCSNNHEITFSASLGKLTLEHLKWSPNLLLYLGFRRCSVMIHKNKTKKQCKWIIEWKISIQDINGWIEFPMDCRIQPYKQGFKLHRPGALVHVSLL